jgi:4'-phosphopantetheinyl transferase
MIHFLFTYFNSKIPEHIWNEYLLRLPSDMQKKITRYVRWQDRQAGLFGKILLIESLRICGYPPSVIHHLSYNPFGKPWISESIDFNISHSGDYVVCAVTNKGKVGIDIERIRAIELADFKRYMSPEEWKHIKYADLPYERFYEYWTMKECVMKAEGKGLSIPLTNICLNDRKAFRSDNNRIWHLKEIFVDPEYKCFLATNLEDSDIRIRKIKLY